VKNLWGAVVLGFVLAASVLLFCMSGPEPEHAGQPLSYWVLNLPARTPFLLTPQLQDERTAPEVLQSIGGDAVPYLLNWLEFEPSPWRVSASKWLNKHFKRHFLEDYQRRAVGAAMAFQYVGPVDEKTKKRLLELVYSPNAALAQRAATALLPITRDNALYQNLALLRIPDPTCQWVALGAFKRMGEDGRPAIPLLIKSLQYQNPAIASETADLLRTRYPMEPHVLIALQEYDKRLRERMATNMTPGLVRH
jgi:hypothetical protein